MRPVAEAEARALVRLHRLARPRHPLMAVTANCDVLEAEASGRGWPCVLGRQHPCSGGRDGDSHRRHAHAYGRRQPGAIPQRALLSGKRLIASARRVRRLSRQALTEDPMVATAPPEGLLASETEPPVGARGLGGGVEAEPVVAASVARGAGGVVCEEALTAAFEGGRREARSVVGHLDDEVSARDVAGDRHARARVLGGVGHKVRGGSRQGGSVERGLGRTRDSRARGRVERHASRPGVWAASARTCSQSSAGRMGPSPPRRTRARPR